MSAENTANNSVVDESNVAEPLSPSLESTPPRSSSFSTPGASHGEQASSKFQLFNVTNTPLQRSTNQLNQTISTAPPFLRDSSQLHSTIPAGLVDINLALGALDLDFGNSRATNIKTSSSDNDAAEISSSSINDAEDSSTQNIEGGEDHHNQQQQQQQHHHQFGPGLIHQGMHPFFPVNEFGQPLHGTFTPDIGSAPSTMNHPWPVKQGFASIGGSVGLENMSHTPPLPPPGMIPMRPFDFHPDGMAMGPQGPMSPHDAEFGNIIPYGAPQMKDGSFNSPNFSPMDNAPQFGQQAHLLQNNQMWPPLNGGPQHMGQSGFGNGNMPPNGINNGNSDRRYPYYQNGNNVHHHHNNSNNNNGNNNHHHHHNHNNHHHNGNNHNHHGGRRMMNNRRRGEDASRFANAKLDDFIGQIYSLCKDQHGCRFLQKQLDLDGANATPIFEETQTHIVELMIDPFGNYLVQKLLEKVNDEQRVTLVKNAAPEFVSIALDPHGTRALQKLIDCLNSDEEAQAVVDSLKDDVLSLSRDLNGNHVIQKCLQRLKSTDSQFIFDTAEEYCLDIATHRHGCCVLQRCLDHGSPEQWKSLALVISGFTVELSHNAFGNYVLQYVLAKDDSEVMEKIVGVIKSNFVDLALQKFGSNVIEKCLRVSKLSGELIDELLKNEDLMVKFLNDPYGNYVLQTALDVAKDEQFDKLSNLLKPLLPQVKNTPHGRRIMGRLQQTVGKPFGSPYTNHFQRVGQSTSPVPVPVESSPHVDASTTDADADVVASPSA